MANRKALNEARAFRGVARRLDAGLLGTSYMDIGVSPELWLQMRARINRHIDPLVGVAYVDGTGDSDAAVIGMLWLALDAEDEAGNNGGTNQ